MFASRLKIGHSLRTAWGVYWLPPVPGESLGLPQRGAVFNFCRILGHKGRLLFLSLPGGSCRLWCLDNLIFGYLRCTPIAPICTAGLLSLPFVVRARSISVCGDSLWIRLCMLEGGGGRGRRDFPQMETENLQHIYMKKASTPSSASDFFPPRCSTNMSVGEKNIMFPETGLSWCWLVWIAWCAKQSCFMWGMVFCNAALRKPVWLLSISFFGSRWLSASAEAQPRPEYSPSSLLLHSPNLFSILPLSKDVNIKQKISRLPQGHGFLGEFIPGTGEKIRKLHLGGKTSLWPFIPLWKSYYQYSSSMIFVFSQLQWLQVRILKSIRFGDFYIFEYFLFS